MASKQRYLQERKPFRRFMAKPAHGVNTSKPPTPPSQPAAQPGGVIIYGDGE